jgi:RNA polymerase sigma factor (sigma-70 family)
MEECQIWPSEDGGFAKNLIRSRAQKLVRSNGLPSTEVEEVEQQLIVDLWQSSQSFNPARGTWHGFATAAVSHAGEKIVRHRHAMKRDERRTTSLNAPTSTLFDEPTELSQTLMGHVRGSHLGLTAMPDELHADLAMDLAQVTETLPENVQSILALVSTHSTSEVVEQTGIKRSTLNDLKRKVRRKLQSAGLEQYLENTPSL